MANSFLEAALGNISMFPLNRPTKVTIEYSPGHTLVLERESLQAFWSEILAMRMILMQMMTPAQEEAGPTVPADDIRTAYEAVKPKAKEPTTEG
jgi:hypothetical protein